MKPEAPTRMLDSGLHLSVAETYRLMAQARRLRREYLRMSVLRLVSWITQRPNRSPRPCQDSRLRRLRTWTLAR